MQPITYENILPGFLLLLLAISGNFLGSTFGCEVYKTFTTDVRYKNLLVYLLMYFTIYFAERQAEHPGISVIKATVLYIFYLFFVKQTPKTLILALFLLVAAFICEQYKDYDEEKNEKMGRLATKDSTSSKSLPPLAIAQIVLAGCCVAISIIGFFVAYKKFSIQQPNITFFKYLIRDFSC